MFSTPKELCKQELKEFVGHKDEVNCVTFSSDFSTVVTGSDDQIVRIFNVKTKKCMATLSGHEGAIRSVAVSSCDQYIASGSFDKTARVWKKADGSCLHVLSGHTKSVEVVAFSCCSQFLCTGSWDRTAILWCIQTGCCLRIMNGHESLVQCLAFSQKHEILATGSWDFTVRIWKLDNKKYMKIIDAYIKNDMTSKDSEAFEAQDTHSITENSNKNVKTTEYEKREFNNLKDNVNQSSIVIINDQAREESTNDDKGSENENMYTESNNCIKNGKCYGTGNRKGIYYLMYKRNTNSNTINDNSESCKKEDKQDERKEATGNDIPDDEVVVDDLKVLTGHSGNIHAVAFSELGMLASGSWDRSIRVWNPLNGDCLSTFLGHTGWVQAVCFSPDSTYCASAADDDSVKIWDVLTGECVNTLQGYTYMTHHCAFTPDGQLIAAGAAVPPDVMNNAKIGSNRSRQTLKKLQAKFHRL